MNWHSMTIEEMLNNIQVSPEAGLDQKEADTRFETFGPNAFTEGKKESLLQKIGHHLKEISTIILLIAAGISTYMALYTGYGWAKVIVILSIVIINVILGITQESRAEKALDALKSLNTVRCTVLRDGVLGHIDAEELVPGDIVVLQAGDMVPADGRLIQANSLQVEESALTGESVPVEKDAQFLAEEESPLGDRRNMVYSGCLVTNGRGKAVICETGMNTEMGKIAGLLNSTHKLLTPLQKRLKSLAQWLSVVAIAAGILIFVVGVFVYQESLAEMLLNGVSLAVAAVPETLPVIVTLILAGGVQQMVTKNTIIRRIPAVETVGNTSVICSDKTGTLTQNKMMIQKFWEASLQPVSSGHAFSEKENRMLKMLSLCTDAVVEGGETEEENIIGDPTEAAILRLMLDKGLQKRKLEEDNPRVFELPFDSTRKRMTTVHHWKEKGTSGKYISITKGAFDRLPVHFEPEGQIRAQEVHDGFAREALRVIGVAFKIWDALPEQLDEGTLEDGLTFLGLVGMIDPPRPESRRAVAHAKKAGIKTVMITGDHVETAAAIAKQIGILEEGERAITGAQLSTMSDEALRKEIRQISVYARVSPEDKIRIVQAWQAEGEVITMTGDGVNDAPALKAADVGAAMGITGTEVSKSAADIIITDDHFATIVDAVKVGRTAYDNIRKTVMFLLSVNFAEILIMLIGVLIGWGAPITSVQLLFINVVSDGIPGFFISREEAEKDLMERKPLSKNASLFSQGLGKKIGVKAFFFIVLTLLAFYLGRFISLNATIVPSYAVGITMAFITLSWASVLNIYNVRSKELLWHQKMIRSNPALSISALASMAVTGIVALVPALQGMFGLTALSAAHWGIAAGLALLQLVFGQLSNYILFRKE